MKQTATRPAARLWALFLATVILIWGVVTPQRAVRADSPPNLTSDINWRAGLGGVFDVESAFNYGRRQEEIQLGLPSGTLSNLDLPSQAVWDTYSDDAKALFLIDAERAARAGMKPGVIGLPLTAVQPNLDAVSQSYADYLMANNKTGHYADGRTPTERIDADPELKRCREFLSRPENLAYFWTSGTSIPLYVEQSVYNLIYDDAGSLWGHREAFLLQDKDLANQNPSYGYNNNVGSTTSEGFIGVGVAKGPHGGYSHGTLVVFNFIDPITTGTCPWEVTPPAPTISGLTPNSGQNTGTVRITNLAGSNFQSGATVSLTRSGYAPINATHVTVVSASKITCRFNLSGVAPGKWGVTVTNPGLLGGTLPNAFTVTTPAPPPGGQRIYTPLAVLRWPEVEVTTDRFDAIADTTVIQGFPNSYRGNEDSMWAGYDACRDGRIVRSLMAFDTGRLPQSARVLSATLYLRHTRYCDYGPSTGSIGAFRIRDNWNTGSVTWNNQPRYTEPPVGQVTMNTRQFGWLSIDVTGLAQTWADRGAGHYGIMIRGPEGSGVPSAAVGFATRQFGQGESAPYIDVSLVGAATAAGPSISAAPAVAPEPGAPGKGSPPTTVPSPPPGLFSGSDPE